MQTTSNPASVLWVRAVVQCQVGMSLIGRCMMIARSTSTSSCQWCMRCEIDSHFDSHFDRNHTDWMAPRMKKGSHFLAPVDSGIASTTVVLARVAMSTTNMMIGMRCCHCSGWCSCTTAALALLRKVDALADRNRMKKTMMGLQQQNVPDMRVVRRVMTRTLS